MRKNREWWQRVVGFPVLLTVVCVSLGYQLMLAWERAVPLTHTDATSWEILIDGYDAMEDGQTPATLAALDQQEVSLYGYMFPLESTESHRHFLLISHSASCPFHQLLGQGNVVEVEAPEGIAYDRAPMLLRGQFHIASEPGADIQYRLANAEQITP